MRLDAVQPGDLVLCDVRGTRFYAQVDVVDVGHLTVDPRRVNGSRATQRVVTARQVVDHFRASRATRRRSRESLESLEMV